MEREWVDLGSAQLEVPAIEVDLLTPGGKAGQGDRMRTARAVLAVLAAMTADCAPMIQSNMETREAVRERNEAGPATAGAGAPGDRYLVIYDRTEIRSGEPQRKINEAAGRGYSLHSLSPMSGVAYGFVAVMERDQDTGPQGP